MSPAYHPPKSEVKDSLERSEECKLLDFYMKGKIILVALVLKWLKKTNIMEQL